MDPDTISRYAWLGFHADERPVESEQGAIDAHKTAELAQLTIGNREKAAEHTREIARREGGRSNPAGVVSHKAENIAAFTHNGALLATPRSTSLALSGKAVRRAELRAKADAKSGVATTPKEHAQAGEAHIAALRSGSDTPEQEKHHREQAESEAKLAGGEWEETKHPRDENGRFTAF